jgi:geranyl-CoA carboxylase alpha subunit
MIAKIIAYGTDRAQARRRLIRAVEDTHIVGVMTNKLFLRQTLKNDQFARGEATTRFIGDNFPDGFRDPTPPSFELIALAAVLPADSGGAGWRSNAWTSHLTRLSLGAEKFCVTLFRSAQGWDVAAEGRHSVMRIERTADRVRFCCNNRVRTARYYIRGDSVELDTGDHQYHFLDVTYQAAVPVAGSAENTIRAPMSGMVVTVAVGTGDVVEPGGVLVVLEAMKMVHQIRAPAGGRIQSVRVVTGAHVAARDILITLQTGAL